MSLTADRLRELLIYDKETGIFTNRVARARGRIPAGSVAGTRRPDGYIQMVIDRKLFLAHRLAVLYVTGRHPELEVDHDDTNRSNNVWTNLRDASRNENGHNTSRSTRNVTGVKGVRWDASRQKWRVSVHARNVKGGLLEGRCDTLIDAVITVRKWREFLHGDFANHG